MEEEDLLNVDSEGSKMGGGVVDIDDGVSEMHHSDAEDEKPSFFPQNDRDAEVHHSDVEDEQPYFFPQNDRDAEVHHSDAEDEQPNFRHSESDAEDKRWLMSMTNDIENTKEELCQLKKKIAKNETKLEMSMMNTDNEISMLNQRIEEKNKEIIRLMGLVIYYHDDKEDRRREKEKRKRMKGSLVTEHCDEPNLKKQMLERMVQKSQTIPKAFSPKNIPKAFFSHVRKDLFIDDAIPKEDVKMQALDQMASGKKRLRTDDKPSNTQSVKYSLSE